MSNLYASKAKLRPETAAEEKKNPYNTLTGKERTDRIDA